MLGVEARADCELSSLFLSPLQLSTSAELARFEGSWVDILSVSCSLQLVRGQPYLTQDGSQGLPVVSLTPSQSMR